MKQRPSDREQSRDTGTKPRRDKRETMKQRREKREPMQGDKQRDSQRGMDSKSRIERGRVREGEMSTRR